MNESERFRAALETIVRLARQPVPPAGEMSRIAWAALHEAGLDPDEHAEEVQVLIQKLKRKAMTTTEKLQQWNPQQCSFDELLELRAAARALRAEYSAHGLESPLWFPKAEASLDEEIGIRSQAKRLRALVVEELKAGPDRQLATFEASMG